MTDQTEQETDPTLDLEAFNRALEEQRAAIFQNAAHTQYGVRVPCPACQQTTQWVEGKDDLFRMQPCGHEVRGVRRRIRVHDSGFLRVDADPS